MVVMTTPTTAQQCTRMPLQVPSWSLLRPKMAAQNSVVYALQGSHVTSLEFGLQLDPFSARQNVPCEKKVLGANQNVPVGPIIDPNGMTMTDEDNLLSAHYPGDVRIRLPACPRGIETIGRGGLGVGPHGGGSRKVGVDAHLRLPS